MNRLQTIQAINAMLLDDAPEYRQEATSFPQNAEYQRRLMRSLMNVRYPKQPMGQAYFRLQDELLSEEREEKGIVHVMQLPVTEKDARLCIWQGDITRLDADAIVNAANSGLLGCFIPCHRCIDNAIHSAAGLQLRDECAALMRQQGHEEATGQAKITKGYNLPCKYILHTVGPIISGHVSGQDQELLASCYRSCLRLAAEYQLKSVAFCCISTGVFHFPNDLASEIAVRTVQEFLDGNSTIKRVIFNVFKDSDAALYWKLLG